MASPQIEDKFFRISNELFDALIRYRISGEARQVLDAIIRQTYGYNRTWSDITLSKFQAMTGLKKSKICLVIKMLITSRIIINNKDNPNLIKYRIQKDYTKWLPLTKKITNPKGRPLTKKIIQINNKDNEALTIKIIPINNKDNPTPSKPLQDKASQNPKDNFKDNKDKDNLKTEDGQNVDNSVDNSEPTFINKTKNDMKGKKPMTSSFEKSKIPKPDKKKLSITEEEYDKMSDPEPF